MVINSFTAGTVVQTDEGDKPIEEVAVGDKVFAEDPETGEQGYFEVVALTNHPTDEVLRVTVQSSQELEEQDKVTGEQGSRVAESQGSRDQTALDAEDKNADNENRQLNSADTEDGQTDTMEITPDHPVYVEDKGWLNAENLSVGDELRRSDGGVAKVLAIERVELAEAQAVYNFTVKGPHTYFVLSSGVLVHNVSCGVEQQWRDAVGPEGINSADVQDFIASGKTPEDIGGARWNPDTDSVELGNVISTKRNDVENIRPPQPAKKVLFEEIPEVELKNQWDDLSPDEQKIVLEGLNKHLPKEYKFDNTKEFENYIKSLDEDLAEAQVFPGNCFHCAVKEGISPRFAGQPRVVLDLKGHGVFAAWHPDKNTFVVIDKSPYGLPEEGYKGYTLKNAVEQHGQPQLFGREKKEFNEVITDWQEGGEGVAGPIGAIDPEHWEKQYRPKLEKRYEDLRDFWDLGL